MRISRPAGISERRVCIPKQPLAAHDRDRGSCPLTDPPIVTENRPSCVESGPLGFLPNLLGAV
jgi:hypothetical protein